MKIFDDIACSGIKAAYRAPFSRVVVTELRSAIMDFSNETYTEPEQGEWDD